MFDGVHTETHGLLISATDLVRWVPRVRPHLERMAAGSGGRYETADLLTELAASNMLLWIVLDGPEVACVMLTQIMQYPRVRAMRCVGVSGQRPRRWVHLLADVERISRETFGCGRMEALHQPRHRALLRTGGWHEFHVLSEKDIL